MPKKVIFICELKTPAACENQLESRDGNRDTIVFCSMKHTPCKKCAYISVGELIHGKGLQTDFDIKDS